MAATTRTLMLSATEKDAALRRIGYFRHRGSRAEPEMDHWRILDWFVRLAREQMPFRQMAESELEVLRQEYRALQEVWGRFNQNVVTVEALEDFRSTVRRHLKDLADTGQTTFGPFTLKRFVYMPAEDPSQTGRAPEVVSGEFVEPFQGQGLLHLLSGLFQQVGLAVRRCPHCSGVFLKSKRNARFCGRTCQANAYARRIREGARAKKLQKKRASARRPTSVRVPRAAGVK